VPVDTTTDEEGSKDSRIIQNQPQTKPFNYSALPDTINIAIPMQPSEGTLRLNPSLTADQFASKANLSPGIFEQDDAKTNNDEPLINQYEQVM